MANQRKIEIFSAGCLACSEVVDLVERIACASCDVRVLDMNVPEVARRARGLGVRTVPAVAIDGKLAECCAAAGPTEAALRAEGVGRPL